jgi:hypothetical protein
MNRLKIGAMLHPDFSHWRWVVTRFLLIPVELSFGDFAMGGAVESGERVHFTRAFAFPDFEKALPPGFCIRDAEEERFLTTEED